jgi:hypothetical protein
MAALRPMSDWLSTAEAAEEAVIEEAMRISADPLPVGAGDWQGCEGNGDEEGTAD